MTHITDLPDEILYEIYKYLEVSTIKSLQLFPVFTQSTRHYLYKHSLYILKVTDEDKPSKRSELPGLEISQINTPMILHIRKFKNYQVGLSLASLEKLIAKLNAITSQLNELFIRDSEEIVTIKLSIQINYTSSTFDEVRSCLDSVNKLSHYFTNNGKNIVTIDLEFKNHN